MVISGAAAAFFIALQAQAYIRADVSKYSGITVYDWSLIIWLSKNGFNFGIHEKLVTY